MESTCRGTEFLHIKYAYIADGGGPSSSWWRCVALDFNDQFDTT